MTAKTPSRFEVFACTVISNFLLSPVYSSYAGSLAFSGTERVLEIGPGTGGMSRHLAALLSKGGSLDSVELSRRMYEQCRKTVKSYDNTSVFYGDLNDIDAISGPYDAVVIHYMLHDVPADHRLPLIRHIAGLLAQGGKLYIREPVKPGHGIESLEIRRLMSSAGLREVRAASDRKLLLGLMFKAEYVKEFDFHTKRNEERSHSMSVLDAIRGRYSVRSYTGEPVEASQLGTVLEAARLSQSAKNTQNWRFVVVRDESTRSRLVPACRNQAFVANAPVVIACCGTQTDYVMTCGQAAYSLDVAIAMENMSLAAYEQGLGTCWLGAFYEDQVKEILGIPDDDVRVVGLLTLGHPASPAPQKKRLPLEEIVKYESWD